MIQRKSTVITDELLGYYRKLLIDTVLPYQYEVLCDRVEGLAPSGAMQNFEIAAGRKQGSHVGRVFQDSDVAKWIEAAAYSLTWHPDPELEARVAETIRLLGEAQWEDGYLNTYFTLVRPTQRFTNLSECHELYCFGHLAEAAVAWYEATGKRDLLDILCRYADLICDTFGPEEGQLHGYDGHQEAELALVRLYRATGNERYLQMADYFLRQRGAQPPFFDEEWEKRGRCYYFYPIPPEQRPSENPRYNQCHLPVTEQRDAVGHAVRFTYMAAGMSEVAAETGAEDLAEACRRLWDSAVDRNMYITGALGSSRHGEAFTYDYDLPGDRVYGETCASVGMMFFAGSMLRRDPGQGRYADVLERELYNVVLSSISLDGRHYFYVNPLEVLPEACRWDGDMARVKPLRQPWYTTACCPPNVARLLGSLDRYLYHTDGTTLYADLYVAGRTEFAIDGQSVTLSVETDYPWDGTVRISVEGKAEFPLALRIPGWAKDFRLELNGEALSLPCEQGYASLCRAFRTGDTVTLRLPVEPMFLRAHPGVRYCGGKVALQAGPLVYCLEELDNGADLAALSVCPGVCLSGEDSTDAPFPSRNYRVTGLRETPPEGAGLYFPAELRCRREQELRFVPYFLWGERNGETPREMAVWVREHE